MSDSNGGFDMTSQSEFNDWTATTLQYALVASGQDEVEEARVLDLRREVTRSLPQRVRYADVVGAILAKADSLLQPEPEVPNEVLNPDDLVPVMQWVLKTVAVVWIAKKRPFVHEQLEAKAEELVTGVQGNRQQPRRADLDLVVRKVVGWGAEQLGVRAVV